MFLALYLWSKTKHNALLLWISLHSCHLRDFRFCELRSLGVGPGKCYILEAHMGVHMAPRSQYKHIVFPRLRLGAVVFPKVSSCGNCARLSGELWRGWRRLASGYKSLQHVLSVAQQPAPAFSFHLTYAPPSPQPAFLPLQKDYQQKLEAGSFLGLHYSYIHLTRLFVCRPFLDLDSHSQTWVKALLLSFVWCLLFSCGLPQRRPGHTIQSDHGWWREDQTGVSHLCPLPQMV